MVHFSKNQINHLIVILIVIAAAVLLYFFLPTILKWFLPFILAYIISYITNPIVTFMEKKLRIPRKIASAITVIFTLLIIGSVITVILYRIIYEIRELANQLPQFIETLPDRWNTLFNKGMRIYVNLPPEISQFVDTVIEAVSDTLFNDLPAKIPSMLKPFTGSTFSFARNFASALPSILIFIIVLFMSTYFISSDKDKIGSFLRKQFPVKWINRAISIKNDLIFALLGYIKAQLILMIITFVEVFIGFIIMGVDYAFLLSLLISVIDALPILGTGTVLIPWAIFSLITGNMPRALSLIILYGIVLLVRQLLEPKIIGKQIGLYPLVTLMSMYIGLQMFVFIGMILGPIVILIVKNLQKAGLIRIWKD